MFPKPATTSCTTIPTGNQKHPCIAYFVEIVFKSVLCVRFVKRVLWDKIANNVKKRRLSVVSSTLSTRYIQTLRS